MTELAAAPRPAADVEAAQAALAPRLRKGDLRAFEELFALSGGTVVFEDRDS